LGLGVAAVVVVAVGVWWQNRPRAERELSGISLGDSVSDVKFKKGKPESEVFDYIWAYPNSAEGAYCFVEFYNNAVDRIFLFPGRGDSFLSFHGVRFKSNLKEITGAFGKPSLLNESTDNMWRLVSYAPYNVAFFLYQDSTLGIAVFDGKRSAGLEIGDKIIQADFQRRKIEKEKREEEEVARERERKRQQDVRNEEVTRANAEKTEADRLEKERRAKADEDLQAVVAQQRRSQQLAAEAARAQRQQEQAKQDLLRRAEVAKWARLKTGMTKEQVEQLLGRPNSISGDDYLFSVWHYPSIPGELSFLRVTFSYGRVKAFEGPDLRR
jgi:outer membrane protein assembly factor BamE (lipoprotein component of BamABCDE complex)